MVIQRNKSLKKAFIIFIFIILVFLITIVLVNINKGIKQQKFFEQEKQRVQQYSSILDFKSLQEVALYLDCTLKKQEKSSKENIEYDIYMSIPINPFEDNQNNQVYYEKLIQYSAFVLEYKNFIILDEAKQLNITVLCNEDSKQISNYYINGVENYFENINSKFNLSNLSKNEIIDLSINSEELNNIVKNSWKLDNLKIGTVETTYRDYDIYFDEGIEIKKVNKKVFNIIFNSKYNKDVVNGLNTNVKKEEVISKLGTPHYELGNLIGYKSKNMYVFFYNNSISIYRVENYSTNKIANIIEKYVDNSDDIKSFINEIKSEWNDYDKYEYDGKYVLLQYTLKGLCIKYDSTTKKGVVLYNNYDGYVYGNITMEQLINGEQTLPQNMYIENENLVFKYEIDRINTLDDSSNSNNYTTRASLNISKEFKVNTQKINENTYSVRFISIDNKYPNSELREYIRMGIWYDDFNFVYSVSGKGIYVYNVKECNYKTIITGTDKYILKRIEGNILYYDNENITINLDN